MSQTQTAPQSPSYRPAELKKRSVTSLYFLFPVYIQVPGAMSARPVISGTRWCSVGAARPASATTTSTCTTQSHVTLRRAPVLIACTTLTAMRASTANRVTTATLPLRAAGVSTTVTSPTYCMYMYTHTSKMEKRQLSSTSVPRWLSCWHRRRQDNQIALYFLK